MKPRTATQSEGATTLTTHAKVGIVGCAGRVGQLLVKELIAGHWDGLSFCGGTVRSNHPTNGQDIGVILGQATLGIKATDNTDALFAASDIVIDFTTPDATAKHIWQAAKHHTPIIIGTTGLNEAQEKELQDAAKETSIVYAANMSVGVNLLQAVVEQVASTLGEDFDIEIMETHHRHKIDAPSGTALALGEAAATGRDVKLKHKAVYSREGHTGERAAGRIGFAVQRGGDVVGEHTVSFFGEGERIELSHKASDRALFARGALRAAQWIKDQKTGLYNMRDVLGL